jgi:O-antigen/teichoic acid export membrane protein
LKKLKRDTLFESGYLSRNLAQKSVRGGITTMTSQGAQFALRIAGTVILARLLTPKDYGLVGMVTVVVGFAEMFKDAGLSMATIQKEAITHEQISTLFWLNAIFSAFLGLCVLAGSPLVSFFYGKPELTAVTAALSISFIISGMAIQHQALLRRHMKFGTLASIQISSQIITLIVTIALAVLGWRYWALVCGSIATAMAGTLLTFFFCPWVPGRMQKGTGVRDMLKFGGHLTGFNFVNYFARNADSILIGKFIGANSLGLYSRAYQLFMMPISQIRGPLDQVAMPVLSSLRNQPERYVKYYQRLLDIMASLTIPLGVYCIIEADFLIRLLLGSQWLAAVPVFRILAIVGLIQAIAGTRGLVLLSYGFSQRYFYWGLFNAGVCIASFIAGIPYGIEGVATAYAIVNYVILVPSLFYCFPKTPVTVTLFFKTLIAPLVISSMAGFSLIIGRQILANDSITSHIALMGLFALIYVGLSMCRQSIRETWGMILKGSIIMFGAKKRKPGLIHEDNY